MGRHVTEESMATKNETRLEVFHFLAGHPHSAILSCFHENQRRTLIFPQIPTIFVIPFFWLVSRVEIRLPNALLICKVAAAT